MKFIADLHIHSKYSRATSKNLNLEELDRWADDKGILVMGTGDFTYPDWVREFKEKLEPAESGLFRLKPQFKLPTIKGTKADTRFLLSSEVSSIYSRVPAGGGDKRVYRVHNLMFAPDIETIEKINTQLSWIGNIKSDGRPILGLDVRELAKIVLNANPQAALVPAHAYTPWFSVFGSMSGFNSLEDAFGDYAKQIFAIETGLSSDPAMNWRLSQLDSIALISNSDSHSLQRIGREANIFDTELSYAGIIAAIKDGIPASRANVDYTPNDTEISVDQRTHQRQSASRFVATIEFFPEEGKYHYDGHRACGVIFSPEETKQHKGLCPRCGKKLTVGVVNRVDELADRPPAAVVMTDFPQKSGTRVPFYNLIPLDEIIGKALRLGTGTKGVKKEYDQLIKHFGNELKILIETPLDAFHGACDPRIAEGLKRVRARKLTIIPGHDGEYGKINIFDEAEQKGHDAQRSLFL